MDYRSRISGGDMTRDFDRVGTKPLQGEMVDAALASIDQAVRMLRTPCGKPPVPPASLTVADRLVGPAAGPT